MSAALERGIRRDQQPSFDAHGNLSSDTTATGVDRHVDRPTESGCRLRNTVSSPLRPGDAPLQPYSTLLLPFQYISQQVSCAPFLSCSPFLSLLACCRKDRHIRINMASQGGSDASPPLSYCHQCSFEGRPLLQPGPTCPRCGSDFMEEVSRETAPQVPTPGDTNIC